MALNTCYQAVIDERRALVARLRLRGLTQREIQESLKGREFVNPRTGKPWSLGTVNADIRAARADWRQAAALDFDSHIAKVLAEIREVRREAWRLSRFDLVLKGWDREVKLLGLNAPDVLALVDWRKEAQEAGIDASDLFEQLVGTAAAAFEESA